MQKFIWPNFRQKACRHGMTQYNFWEAASQHLEPYQLIVPDGVSLVSICSLVEEYYVNEVIEWHAYGRCEYLHRFIDAKIHIIDHDVEHGCCIEYLHRFIDAKIHRCKQKIFKKFLEWIFASINRCKYSKNENDTHTWRLLDCHSAYV